MDGGTFYGRNLNGGLHGSFPNASPSPPSVTPGVQVPYNLQQPPHFYPQPVMGNNGEQLDKILKLLEDQVLVLIIYSNIQYKCYFHNYSVWLPTCANMTTHDFYVFGVGESN